MFKIVNSYEDVDRNMFFKLKEGSRKRGHKAALVKEQCRLDMRKYSFSQRVINEWNKLPNDCGNASSVNMFKNRIDRYLIRAIDTVMVPPEHLPKTYEQHLKQTIENLRLARTLATENINHTIERNKEAHDVKAKDPNFQVGQSVYIPHVQKGMSSKLQRKWKGPYYIVECGDNHTYSLRNADSCIT